MANKLLVSLISKQTIPNVQFLKWYANKFKEEGPFDLLFVTTEEMEGLGKSEEVLKGIKALDYPYEYHYLQPVNQNDLSDVVSQLNFFFEDYPHENVVFNITGGTKIMSLGVFEFAKGLDNATVYYKPIDSYLQKIFPSFEIVKDNLDLSIDEYFKAVGCEYSIEPQEQHSEKYILKVKDFLGKNSSCLSVFNKISAKNNEDKSFNLRLVKDKENVPNAISLCETLDIDPEKIPVWFPKFILGGWYEEYIYYLLKSELDCSAGEICTNLKIQDGTDNEFDVVYISGETLCVVECKAYMKDKSAGKKLTDSLYKLIALRERLGIGVKLCLYTTQKNISAAIELRALQNNIKIVRTKM